MKYALVLLVVMLAGCATNADGTHSVGVVESPAWFFTAGVENISAHFDAMPVHKLCIRWAETRNADVRNAISESLVRRKMNPLYCY